MLLLCLCWLKWEPPAAALPPEDSPSPCHSRRTTPRGPSPPAAPLPNHIAPRADPAESSSKKKKREEEGSCHHHRATPKPHRHYPRHVPRCMVAVGVHGHCSHGGQAASRLHPEQMQLWCLTKQGFQQATEAHCARGHGSLVDKVKSPCAQATSDGRDIVRKMGKETEWQPCR